jgi:hypothetical protein
MEMNWLCLDALKLVRGFSGAGLWVLLGSGYWVLKMAKAREVE